jgi:hypothetical protein
MTACYRRGPRSLTLCMSGGRRPKAEAHWQATLASRPLDALVMPQCRNHTLENEHGPHLRCDPPRTRHYTQRTDPRKHCADITNPLAFAARTTVHRSDRRHLGLDSARIDAYQLHLPPPPAMSARPEHARNQGPHDARLTEADHDDLSTASAEITTGSRTTT